MEKGKTINSIKLVGKFVVIFFVLLITLLGFNFFRSMDKVSMQFIEQGEAGQYYKDKLEESDSTNKWMRKNINSLRVEVSVNKIKIDSIGKVTLDQSKQIQLLKNEKNKLIDSINRIRYKSKSFGPD